MEQYGGVRNVDVELMSTIPERCGELTSKREEGDIPIASPGRTISITIPIVSDVLLGECGVFAISQPCSTRCEADYCPKQRTKGGKTYQVTNTSLLPQ